MARFSIDQLDEVVLPSNIGENKAEEELLFSSSESAVHLDHKTVAAQQDALGVATQQVRRLQIENDDLAELGPHRRAYSWCILVVAVIFMVATFCFLLAATYMVPVPVGDIVEYRALVQVDNKVLMVLLGTNLVQVIGLLYVVAKWLFPTRSLKPVMGK